MSQPFPKSRHLRHPREFARVYAVRCTARNPQVLVFAAVNHLPHPRLGLSVSRKQGGAVTRNRIKRLLRETFRLTQPTWPAGFDYILVPQNLQNATLVELLESLPVLAGQAARRAGRKAQQEADRPDAAGPKLRDGQRDEQPAVPPPS